MSEEAKKLLQQIDGAHDWEEGQAYSDGTRYWRFWICQTCGLKRRVKGDEAGSGPYYTFVLPSDDTLSLREAAQQVCRLP